MFFFCFAPKFPRSVSAAVQVKAVGVSMVEMAWISVVVRGMHVVVNAQKMRIYWGDLFGSGAASRMSFCSGGNIFPEASPFPLLFLIESRPNSSPDAFILFFLLSPQLISGGISNSSSLLTPSRRGVSHKRNARARSREKKALPTPNPGFPPKVIRRRNKIRIAIGNIVRGNKQEVLLYGEKRCGSSMKLISAAPLLSCIDKRGREKHA